VVFNLGSRRHSGREAFLEGWRADISCTQLNYTCFSRVLDGVRWVIVVAIMGRGTKKVENHWCKQTLKAYCIVRMLNVNGKTKRSYFPAKDSQTFPIHVYQISF